jgi:hypothetical protein
MKTLNLIFLSGAGGVGKTSVAKEILALGTEQGLKVSLTQSTTRASYAKMGIRDEALGRALTVEDQVALQEQIFIDYCENLKVSVDNAIKDDKDILCIDRSPYDHNSYFFQLVPTLDLRVIEQRMDMADEVMKYVLNRGWNNDSLRIESFIWFFAYPTAWAQEKKEEEDGFRYAPAAKNYIWSLTLEQMLSKYEIKSFSPYNLSTPKYRALRILDEITNLASSKGDVNG